MRDLNYIIHETPQADLDMYVYTKVYAGANASPIINGSTINMVGGSSLEILIQSISSTANVYVLGRKKPNVPIIINR